MIKREKDYLKKKKKKYIWLTLIWLVVMFSVFIVGYVLNRTRNNIFTVFAAVLVLPAAQYSTQLFTLWKFNDPDIEISNQLEALKGNYSLFHSVLVPDKTSITFFDHILVTGTKIYCIIDKPTNLGEIKTMFNHKTNTKGIPSKAIVYVEQSETKDIGNILKKIQQNIAIENQENLDEYTQLISQMMM